MPMIKVDRGEVEALRGAAQLMDDVEEMDDSRVGLTFRHSEVMPNVRDALNKILVEVGESGSEEVFLTRAQLSDVRTVLVQTESILTTQNAREALNLSPTINEVLDLGRVSGKVNTTLKNVT